MDNSNENSFIDDEPVKNLDHKMLVTLKEHDEDDDVLEDSLDNL